MKSGKNDMEGISTVTALLAIFSLILIFAGIATAFAFQLCKNNSESGYNLIDVELDGRNDMILISLTNGVSLEVQYMQVNLEGNLVDLSGAKMTALSPGTTMIVSSPLDIIEDIEYNFKIMYRDRMIINNYVRAGSMA